MIYVLLGFLIAQNFLLQKKLRTLENQNIYRIELLRESINHYFKRKESSD